MVAIARGGEGDVTETHVRWRWTRGLPYVSSPLLHRGRIWLARAGGTVTCLDAATGECQIDRGRMADRSEYYMSPVGAGEHVLVGSADGALYVLRANATALEIEHTAQFGEALFATPAVLDGKVYVRTASTLWAFGA
jgi:outer membrane protein assembly factor BamB